jgi:hypothetical protein
MDGQRTRRHRLVNGFMVVPPEKNKKPVPDKFAGTGTFTCGATLLGAYAAPTHRVPSYADPFYGGSVPSPILGLAPFRSPSGVHSIRFSLPRFHRRRLSGREGSRIYSLSLIGLAAFYPIEKRLSSVFLKFFALRLTRDKDKAQKYYPLTRPSKSGPLPFSQF